MPDSYVHRRFAAGLTDRLTPAAIALITADEDCFLVGSLGPDPLFAHRFWKPFAPDSTRELGSVLHTRDTGAFAKALLQAAADDVPSTRAWALGYLCHVAADSSIHPYVYALTGIANDRPFRGGHFALEAAWESLYYHQDHPDQRCPVPPPSRELADLSEGARQAIGRVVSAAAAVSHGALVPAGDISQSIGHMATLNGLLSSPHGGKHALARALEALSGQRGALATHFAPRRLPADDPLNLEHRTWHSPWEPDRARSESVPELYRAGEALAVSSLNAAADFFTGAMSLEDAMAVIGNRSLHSGLDSSTGRAE